MEECSVADYNDGRYVILMCAKTCGLIGYRPMDQRSFLDVSASSTEDPV